MFVYGGGNTNRQESRMSRELSVTESNARLWALSEQVPHVRVLVHTKRTPRPILG